MKPADITNMSNIFSSEKWVRKRICVSQFTMSLCADRLMLVIIPSEAVSSHSNPTLTEIDPCCENGCNSNNASLMHLFGELVSSSWRPEPLAITQFHYRLSHLCKWLCDWNTVQLTVPKIPNMWSRGPLEQWFPTTVPRHTSVPWEIIRYAVEDYPISSDWYSKWAACSDRQNN